MVPEREQVARPPAILTFTAGTTIFDQGDSSDWVYVVQSGEVDIVRILADGAEEHLRTMREGEYFGELGPMLGFPRAASARARTDVETRIYEIGEFREQ